MIGVVVRVVALHKKGDRLKKEKDHLISLMSSCCKILEHILIHFITEFLEWNKLLSHHQHGFHKSLSTITQFTTTIPETALTLGLTGQIDLYFWISAKLLTLFPTGTNFTNFVCHFWFKIESNSNCPTELKFVDVDRCSSTYLPVTSGVPQGSVGTNSFSFVCERYYRSCVPWWSNWAVLSMIVWFSMK